MRNYQVTGRAEPTNPAPRPPCRHHWAKVPARRYRAHGLEREYPHGAVICAVCLETRAAKRGEAAGLPDVVAIWRDVDKEDLGHKAGGPKKLGRWSRYWDSCRRCGTTEQKHNADGLCGSCYKARKYEADRAAAAGARA